MLSLCSIYCLCRLTGRHVVRFHSGLKKAPLSSIITMKALNVWLTMLNHKRARFGEAITMTNGPRRDDLISNEDDPHVQANMEVIREYLRRQFKGFGLTEKPNAPLSYTFTMTRSSDEEYKLKVYWPQLADQSHTPERTQQRLVTDDVAGRMRGKSQGEYFTWRHCRTGHGRRS